ncbi:site-2 protease family protein [Pseudoflavitalea rhizosphaerae]|uniref:site-2 protease family protein n=1 Tax=Pseudoflavitalea rhizosphaerae TaxID=1884793 RepID=UPI000F8C732B|nr:site-2 protease family protein [Pseudoflavitalea rhizosphaerae]
MHGSFKLISVRGINIFLHWTFLLLFGWVFLVNAHNGSNIIELSWAVLFIAGLFISVLLHELGHAVTAMEYGIEAKNIVLMPFGGIASIGKFPGNPRQELLISFSGPLVNLIIAGLLKIMFPAETMIPADYTQVSIAHGHDFILNLFLANIVLAIFNLIPAFPLDGGRVLRALLAFRLNYIRATYIANITGKFIAAVMIGAGIVFFSPLLPIAGFFIIFAEDTEEYYLQIRSLVKDVRIRDVTMFDYHSLPSNFTARQASDILLHNHSEYFVVLEEDKPIGSINRLNIITALAEKRENTQLKDLHRYDDEILDANQLVDPLLEQLAVNDKKIFPVMENGYFTGVVSLNHIIEYLLLQKADSEDYKRVKSLSLLLH